MTNILVCYPSLFNCYQKFERKVSNIIRNLDSPALIFVEDANGFISRFSELHSPDTQKVDDWSSALSEATNKIVFDDGEAFSDIDITQKISERKIPARRIKILITRVINIKKETEYSSKRNTSDYEYIGRGSYWGNPHSMYEKGDDREEVIRKFKYDFDFDKFPNKSKSEVYRLAGKRLGCFCKPQSCHGDVLADFLNSWDDGK